MQVSDPINFHRSANMYYSSTADCPASSITFTEGNITCSNGAKYGSSCYFSCSNVERLEGSSYITCQDDGQWSAVQPSCQGIL